MTALAAPSDLRLAELELGLALAELELIDLDAELALELSRRGPIPVRTPSNEPVPAQRARAGRVARVFALWIVLGLSFGLLAAASVPLAFGYKSLIVLSGSMNPTLQVGDLIVVHPIRPIDAHVGDIVSFRDPEDHSRLITHRVRSVHMADGMVSIRTKGDANTSVEDWNVPFDGAIGRVVYRIPRVGYPLYWANGRAMQFVLVVIPALALGFVELLRIWRRPPKREALDAAV